MSDGNGFELRMRFPTLENSLRNYGGAFGSAGTPLTTAERGIARTVFQSSIDTNRVRVKRTRVAAVGGTAAMVWGNTILVNPSVTLTPTLLVHELTHIWQYQTTGTRYLSDAITHRSYRARIVPGRSISRYEPEQQATIVENYYLYHHQGGVFTSQFIADNPNTAATLSELNRLIEEVRRRRPMPELAITEELQRSMTGGATDRIFGPRIDPWNRQMPVYQFELRFGRR